MNETLDKTSSELMPDNSTRSTALNVINDLSSATITSLTNDRVPIIPAPIVTASFSNFGVTFILEKKLPMNSASNSDFASTANTSYNFSATNDFDSPLFGSSSQTYDAVIRENTDNQSDQVQLNTDVISSIINDSITELLHSNPSENTLLSQAGEMSQKIDT